MVRQDLVGAIESATARGESLKNAMMTLFNAGYPRQEIEAAAREVQKTQLAAQPKPKTPVRPIKSPSQSAPLSRSKVKPTEIPVQKVSGYGQPTKHQQIQQRIKARRPIPLRQGAKAPPRMPGAPTKPGALIKSIDKPDKKTKLTMIVLAAIEFCLFIFLILSFVFKNAIVDFFNGF